jgi:hypothetical protein
MRKGYCAPNVLRGGMSPIAGSTSRREVAPDRLREDAGDVTHRWHDRVRLGIPIRTPRAFAIRAVGSATKRPIAVPHVRQPPEESASRTSVRRT